VLAGASKPAQPSGVHITPLSHAIFLARTGTKECLAPVAQPKGCHV
jgi:hypothetical protein